MTITQPGFYTMTDDEYHADPCETPSLNSGMASDILEKTEIEAMLSSRRLNPNYRDKKSDEMDLGTVAHDIILRGDTGVYEIAPFDAWRSNDAKAARAQIEAKGLIALNETTGPRIINDVNLMKSALRKQMDEHQDYPGLMSIGVAEECVFAKDGDLWLRAKIDWLDDAYPDLIVDYKTTGIDFSQWEKNELWSCKYMQSPHYRRTYDLATGKKSKFIFVVQQTKYPFLVKIFELDKSYEDEIGMRYVTAQKRFTNCLKTGVWRGEPPYAVHSYPPKWIMEKWDMAVLDDRNIASKEKTQLTSMMGG